MAAAAPRVDGEPMSAISLQVRERLESAIQAAEALTSADMAVVVARASDQYAAFPLLWSTILSFAAGGAVVLAVPKAGGGTVLAVEALLFVVAGFALYHKSLRFGLVPPAIRHAHAARLARMEFAALEHERPAGESGLLLFISLAERHAEILVDRSVADRIPQAAWQEIVGALVQSLSAGAVTEGIVGAIGSCAVTLQPHFPPAAQRKADTAGRVIEI